MPPAIDVSVRIPNRQSVEVPDRRQWYNLVTGRFKVKLLAKVVTGMAGGYMHQH